MATRLYTYRADEVAQDRAALDAIYRKLGIVDTAKSDRQAQSAAILRPSAGSNLARAFS